MSELTRSLEIEPTVEVISGSIEHWLMKEVGSSVVGRNKFLDDFREWHSNLLLPYEHPGNVDAEKNKGHYNRLINWTNGLMDHYEGFGPDEADYALARQMFCAQMYLSGLFRVHCFMTTKDQNDYYRKRLELVRAGLGIDTQTMVSQSLYRLYDYIPEPTVFRPVLTLPELTSRTLALNDEQQEYVRELHISGRNDVGQDESTTIDNILGMERKWTSHLVDYIAFTAGERGGQLAAVPFLEPKSISDDPQPYYPFAAEAS